MNLAPSGSDFDLYAGKDDSIKVERKELVSKRSETGLLNRREVEDRRYQISLQNFRSGPIRLEVDDQLPVSKNADIAVNQGAFSDKPTAIDKDTGKLAGILTFNRRSRRSSNSIIPLSGPRVRKSLAVLEASPFVFIVLRPRCRVLQRKSVRVPIVPQFLIVKHLGISRTRRDA